MSSSLSSTNQPENLLVKERILVILSQQELNMDSEYRDCLRWFGNSVARLQTEIETLETDHQGILDLDGDNLGALSTFRRCLVNALTPIINSDQSFKGLTGNLEDQFLLL